MAKKSGPTRRRVLKSGAVIPCLAVIGFAIGVTSPAEAGCGDSCSSSCKGDCMGGCARRCGGCDGTCTSESKS